ncbi:MAG: helix-turn-helix transcriptional regulator [Turicibacter sp.]|nr:helix-turn-helix transcriptional regulator [Turicibacter sp.]
MNDFNFLQQTPIEVNQQIATRLREIRKKQAISQQVLSERSGVSYGSIKRFEQTGDISLISLTKIAIALDVSDELENLFKDMPILSIEEIINGQH